MAKTPRRVSQVAGRRLQRLRRQVPPGFDQGVRRQLGGRTADGQRAAGAGAGPGFDPVGIALDDADARRIDAEARRRDLGESRGVALSAGLRADQELDPAVVGDDQCRRFGKVEARHVDMHGEAEAAPAALRFGLPLPRREALSVRRRAGCIEQRAVVAGILAQVGRVGPGQGGRRQQIAPAHLDGVAAEPPGCGVDQPLGNVDAFGLAGAAKIAGRRRVGMEGAHLIIDCRHGIDIGDDIAGVAQRDDAAGREIGAQIAGRAHADGEDAAFAVERHFGPAGLLPAADVAQQAFIAPADPFDRPAEPARCPHREALLGIEHILDAEAAADIRHLHGDLLWRDTEYLRRQGLAHGMRLAAVGVEDHAVTVGLIGADTGTVLDGRAEEPVARQFDGFDMRGSRERRVGRGRVSKVDGKAEIARRLRPQCRHCRGLGTVGAGRQRVVVRRDQFRRVAGGGFALGDDHGDDLAAEPHRIVGDQRLRRCDGRIAQGRQGVGWCVGRRADLPGHAAQARRRQHPRR